MCDTCRRAYLYLDRCFQSKRIHGISSLTTSSSAIRILTITMFIAIFTVAVINQSSSQFAVRGHRYQHIMEVVIQTNVVMSNNVVDNNNNNNYNVQFISPIPTPLQECQRWDPTDCINVECGLQSKSYNSQSHLCSCYTPESRITPTIFILGCQKCGSTRYNIARSRFINPSCCFCMCPHVIIFLSQFFIIHLHLSF